MKLLTLILCLWIVPAYATPITYQFNGLTGIGDVTGTFTVDTDIQVGTNVRNLAGNVAYSISSWQFLAQSINYSYLQTTLFASGLDGNSAEYCVGDCVFSFHNTTTLRLLAPNGYQIQLTLDPALYQPASYFRQYNGAMAMINQGSYYVIPDAVPDTTSPYWAFLSIPLFMWLNRKVC